jgi:hypothetical protein
MSSPPSGCRSRCFSRLRPRCDHQFIELLEEDFGIPQFALSNAFMGVPAEPKKSAIALCEWAISEADDPARALLAWARKHGRGTFGRPCSSQADEDKDSSSLDL